MGLVTQLNAQITITGKVIDEQQQPVPYANIVLLSLPDSTFVAGSISNEEGAFSLNVKETKDVLRISSIGYATVYRPLDNRSTDLGIICLASDTQILAEVVVKADMPVTRMRGDALVTNIQNSVLSKAGSASDVLGKVPGVIKERNSYEVLGKGTPLIYINGRQVRDDSELDQLNSEDIKSVEVVTNPGARYDATVTAVIRIQTIRRAGDGFGFDLRSSYYQSQNVDLIEQLNVNYRHNGLDIFGIFRYLKNEYIMKNDIVHTLESDSLWKYQNLLDGTVVDKSLRGEIGANYSLNDKHSLGFRYTLTSRPNTKSDVFTSNDITANNQFYDYLENQEYSSTSGNPTHQLNVYYNGTVGDLNIDFNTVHVSRASLETAASVSGCPERVMNLQYFVQVIEENRHLPGKCFRIVPECGHRMIQMQSMANHTQAICHLCANQCGIGAGKGNLGNFRLHPVQILFHSCKVHSNSRFSRRNGVCPRNVGGKCQEALHLCIKFFYGFKGVFAGHDCEGQRRVVQRCMFQMVIIAQIPCGLEGVFSGALIDETVAEPGR